MNDRAVSLLEQYEIEVLRTRKGRGSILCDTSQGSLILKEYTGSEERIQVQDRLLKQITRSGRVLVENIIPTKEGALFVKDHDGVRYVLKTYFEGRECNIYDKGECVEAVRLLARLHGCMELTEEEGKPLPAVVCPEREYEKHNKELRRVKRYLKQKSQKNWFEICLLNTFDRFLEQALTVSEEWKEYSRIFQPEEKGSRMFCHGDYQYHNILRYEKGWCVINFDRCMPDRPIRDLYLLLRKLLEKSGWAVPLGKELLAAYDEISPLSAGEWIDLYYRLAYPEKFWKIANFYYNSGKAWIPERNQEKLEKLMAQEKEKQHFLDTVFRDVTKCD